MINLLTRSLTWVGFFALVGSGSFYLLQADQQQATSEAISQEEMKQISEAFGHYIGRNLDSPGLKFDLDSVIQGIRDGASGKPAPLSDELYEEKLIKLQKSAFAAQSSLNLKAANEFLEKNSKEKDIREIEPNKLQFLVLTEGNGPVVEAGATPMIHYLGKFLDGTVFGNSEELGEPIMLPLNQTIAGFSKGIQGMKEGEKRRLFIHPDLGYGTAGHVPPNSLLIFDVEVIKASTPKAEAASDDELLPLSLEDNDETDSLDEADDIEENFNSSPSHK